MDAIPVPALGADAVVELVNAFGDRPRKEAGEQSTPYPHVASILGFEPRSRAAVVDVANATFRVFAAASDTEARDALNALLGLGRPTPVVTDAGLRWVVGSEDAVLAAALGTCLLTWVEGRGSARLGTCDAERCVDVYADSSPAGRRRFCSSTCLSRHKVAAFRARASSRG